MRWYRKAADQGLANAQNSLGLCYDNGTGVNKDAREAVKWYRKAANQGYAWGQYNLGGCYLYGTGVTKNKLAGKAWLEKAYKNNDAAAKKAAEELWAKNKK